MKRPWSTTRSTRRVLDEFSDQGWNDDTQFHLLMEYIDYHLDVEELRAFLKDRAENGWIGID